MSNRMLAVTGDSIRAGEAPERLCNSVSGPQGLQVGNRILCDGGFAEETVQPASNVIKLPDAVRL